MVNRGNDGVLRKRSAMGVRVELDGAGFIGDSGMRDKLLELSAVVDSECKDDEGEDKTGVDNGLRTAGTLSVNDGFVIDKPDM